MNVRKLPTNTLLTRAKRDAKRAATSERSYTECLDEQAQLAGYPDWRTLAMANDQRNTGEWEEIPLDPVLPAHFDDTPNEERSKKELDEWWDKPFIQTREDGSFEARALNGGAWDRTTYLGVAGTLAEARALARKKQVEWIARRSEPVAYIRPDGLIDLVIMARRPDMGNTVVVRGVRPEAVPAARVRLLGKSSQLQMTPLPAFEIKYGGTPSNRGKHVGIE